MSHEIVKKIEINKDEKKVYITGCSNNVRPRTPRRWECTYYKELAQAEKWDEIELDILDAYISGNFQGTKNKYTRALQVLTKMPEYKKFDWRTNWDESRKNQETKKEEYQALLKLALRTRLPKEKYIIVKQLVSGVVYFRHRKNSYYCHWYREEARATKFNYREDAENTIKHFTDSKEWQVIELDKN